MTHFAALISTMYSYLAPRTYLETDAMGATNFLEAARRAGVSLAVHTSASEVPETAQPVPIDEKHPLAGVNNFCHHPGSLATVRL